MRVPSTINKNCLKAYEPEKTFAKRWQNKKLRSYSIQNWDWKIPKSLQELCIEHIAQNWPENPILEEIVLLEDKHLLLDILPESLPLELTLPKIQDEIYWKKCFTKRWPKLAPKIRINIDTPSKTVKIGINATNEEYLSSVLASASETENDSLSSRVSSRRASKKIRLEVFEGERRTWKKHYCEMHIKDYLERLRPENYNPEKIKELCDLCGPHVEILNVEEMISSENSPNKIPLNAIITGLGNLTEISLKFKQAYAKDDFSWNIVNISYQDISLFSKGLEKIRLKKLRITNSDIDCDKAIMILKSLLKHDLEILDFSHCKIGDRGAMALAKFLTENCVEEVFLANNRIGPKGVNCLAYALAQKPCKLKRLDLRLNQFLDASGNILINSIFLYNKSLKNLCISGCGLTSNFQLSEALKSKNQHLSTIDLSNNLFDEEFGLRLLEALNYNKTLIKLDLRLCKITSNVEAQIQEEIYNNRKGVGKIIGDFPVEEISDICWDDKLIEEMDEVFAEGLQDASIDGA